MVECEGAETEVACTTASIRSILETHGALELRSARDEDERRKLWAGRKGAFGAMGRIAPDLYVADAVVPRTKLRETVARTAAICRERSLRLATVFHAGDGNLHPNISYDGRDTDETRRVVQAGHDILTLCMEMGGSITGEHGIGTEKLEHVPLMFDPCDLEVMERVRTVFNPNNLCNPGKVLPERRSCAEVAKWPAMVERVLEDDA